jgi:Asp-tRNA(Asn)/Glu-tRNA(Gln) amidotransferase A subunit family amidase
VTAHPILIAVPSERVAMTPHFRSAEQIADGVRTGDQDPVAVVDGFLDRIDDRGDVTNAFVTVIESEARAAAREVRERLDAGEELPLAGVPVGIKDLGDRKAGVPATNGLLPLADHVADETSVLVRRLEDAGAVVVGTTNTPAMGHTVRTVNELVGPTGTPFDPERNAGGSSGGSAGALADGLCTLATGSDVGGSLRNPASCCNVVSVKPTHGLVPNGSAVNAYGGHTPFAVRGPMARDVESLALMLDVLAGRDPVDPFSLPKRRTYRDAVRTTPDPASIDLAYSPGLGLFPVAPAVRDSVESTLDDLEAAGATVDRVSPDTPDRHTVNQTYLRTVTTFFATGVAELNREMGFDLVEDHAEELPEVLVDLVEAGESHDLTAYTHADFPRTDLYHAFEDAMAGYDALVCPTLATPPLSHDEPIPTEIDGEETNGMPTDWTLAWIFNLTGHPAVNVPADLADGLPVGMQVVGPTFSEPRLLEIAAAVEETSPWSYPDA